MDHAWLAEQHDTLVLAIADREKSDRIRQWSRFKLTRKRYTFDCLKPLKFYRWQPASGMSGIYHLELSTHPPALARLRKNENKITKKEKQQTTGYSIMFFFFFRNSCIRHWQVRGGSHLFFALRQGRLKQICFKVAGKAVKLPAWAVLREQEFPAVAGARRPCQLFVYIERCSRQYECAWGGGSYSSLPMNHCHENCQLNRGKRREAEWCHQGMHVLLQKK